MGCPSQHPPALAKVSEGCCQLSPAGSQEHPGAFQRHVS